MGANELPLKPKLIKATLDDYLAVQNMWRFYVYEMGRYCGFNEGWECPSSLSFVPDDLTNYFVKQARKAYLIKIVDELAGFVLLDKESISPCTHWNMGEFFILAKFQGKGIGKQSAGQIWEMHQGLWEVSVIPENRSALNFWRKVILQHTKNCFSEEIKNVSYDIFNPKRIVFFFNFGKN